MLVWFAVLALLGLYGIARAPAILGAVDPRAALGFMLHAGPGISFAILGAAFLAVTGGEAMYADMGHFGAASIRLSWFAVVLPCLVLNYFGQGGLLLAEPTAIDNPFYQLAPGLAALSSGGLRHGRHRHRQPSHHLGRLLAHPAVDPAWVPAQDAHRPHGGRRDRADLPAARQLAAGRRDARGRAGLRLLGRAGGRLRHRGLGAHGHHDGAGGAGRRAMGLPAGCRAGGERRLLRHRPRLLLGQRREAVRGRLVSPDAGPRRGLPDADVAARHDPRRATARRDARAGVAARRGLRRPPRRDAGQAPSPAHRRRLPRGQHLGPAPAPDAVRAHQPRPAAARAAGLGGNQRAAARRARGARRRGPGRRGHRPRDPHLRPSTRPRPCRKGSGSRWSAGCSPTSTSRP